MLLRGLFCVKAGPSVRHAVQISHRRRRIDRVLIANRGEVALRIMKTAKRMGIETVAVYSDADSSSMHVVEADFAYNIGASSLLHSYLNKRRIIEVAKTSGAQAIHPGYGFLSENAEFAEGCVDAGLIFIGPSAKAIRDMGAKDIAKNIMESSGVSVVKGYHGQDQSALKLRQEADAIGYPVILKAVHGGGGKGMKIVWNEKEFDEKLISARFEASKSFGNAAMIVEKFIEKPRHIEVQVFGDFYGNYVYLWERDCSIQRRHQKIIEEAPACGLNDDIRNELGIAAVKACKAVDYAGAGTVEFIMNSQGKFYFMEMNTRLQVEHSVSEAITGIDFVEWQFRVARGEELPFGQKQIKLNGHAIEARIYAENTCADFMPTAGKLDYLSFPSSVRIETGVQQGDRISIHYDPMIAKIIAWDVNREEAILKLRKALSNTYIIGLSTNVTFICKVLDQPAYREGRATTDFIENHKSKLLHTEKPSRDDFCDVIVAHYLFSCYYSNGDSTPFQTNDCFRLSHNATRQITLASGSFVVEFLRNNILKIQFENGPQLVYFEKDKITRTEVGFITVVNGERRKNKAVLSKDRISVFGRIRHDYLFLNGNGVTETELKTDTDAYAPMPGTIERILVKPGDRVMQGKPMLVMVAMKMEYSVRAPKDLIVDRVLCFVGENVKKNAQLVHFTVI